MILLRRLKLSVTQGFQLIDLPMISISSKLIYTFNIISWIFLNFCFYFVFPGVAQPNYTINTKERVTSCLPPNPSSTQITLSIIGFYHCDLSLPLSPYPHFTMKKGLYFLIVWDYVLSGLYNILTQRADSKLPNTKLFLSC